MSTWPASADPAALGVWAYALGVGINHLDSNACPDEAIVALYGEQSGWSEASSS